MSWTLAPKHQLWLSGPDVARTFQSLLKPHLDDKNKNKKAGNPFAHIVWRKQAGLGPAGDWEVLQWSPECEPGPRCPEIGQILRNQHKQCLDHWDCTVAIV